MRFGDFYTSCLIENLFIETKCLASLNTQPDKVGKYTKCKIFLADYNFEIKHNAGTLHPADLISMLERKQDIQKEEQK